MLFWPIFGNLWCPVVTLVPFSSNLSNFEKNPKNKNKKFKNILFNFFLNVKKIQKIIYIFFLIFKNPKIPLFVAPQKMLSS